MLNYLKMAEPRRFERLTARLEGECSIQLSYGSIAHTLDIIYYLKKDFKFYFMKKIFVLYIFIIYNR